MLKQLDPSSLIPIPVDPLQARTRRVHLLGVGIDRRRRDEAVERIAGFIRDGRPHQVVTVNLDYLRLAGESPEFRCVLNQADLAVADGMPLVWASRLARRPLPERVPGLDLVEALCARGAVEGWSIFLLGAAPAVAVEAAEAIARRYPGLEVAGSYGPPIGPFDQDEEIYIIERIRAAAPHLLLVALGAPRQDVWLHDHLGTLRVPVSIGVGCTLDVIGGSKLRAPAWMQHSGLEWLFRLRQEPRRLARRYLLRDLPALAALLLDAVAPAQSRRATGVVNFALPTAREGGQ